MTTLLHAIFRLMSPVLRRPLCCIALLWITGIIIASRTEFPWQCWAMAGLLFCLAWGVTHAWDARIALIALSLATIALSAARYGWQATPLSPDDPRYLPTGSITLIGYPVAPAIEANDSWHVRFRLLARAAGPERQGARGDIYLSGTGEPPVAGQVYRLLARVLPAEEPGNPFGFSWPTYLHEQNYTHAAYTYALDRLPGRVPVSRMYALRAYLARRLMETTRHEYGAIYAGLLDSLLLGVHGAALPEGMAAQFRRAGTIHLMVVSGSQVALLAGFLLLPLSLAPRGRQTSTYPRWRMLLLLLALPILGLYLALADRGPSVDRAIIMVLLATLSVFLGFSPLARQRSFRPDGLTLLAVAALITLVSNPSLLFSPGMQLSFAAVFGLMVLTPLFLRLLHRPLGKVAMLPAATLGAQLMTVPILAWHFGAVPVLGIVTNLIAIPVVGILVPLGLITLLFSVTIPQVAVFLNHGNVALLSVLLSTSALAANLPWAEWHWVVRSSWPILAYLGGLVCIGTLMSWWLHRIEKDWSVPAGREPRMW